jgi:hypothetical protein
LDAKLARIKELIEQKDAIHSELERLIAGAPLKQVKVRVCTNCGAEGHPARSCPQKQLSLSQ